MGNSPDPPFFISENLNCHFAPSTVCPALRAVIAGREVRVVQAVEAVGGLKPVDAVVVVVIAA